MLLITGATGFVGKNLIPYLAKKHRLRILVRRTSDISLFKNMKGIEIAYGDLEHNEGLEHALCGTDTVVHCAARTIGRNLAEYYRTNTLGTIHLVRAMEKMKVWRILYLSSHAACGPCAANEPHTEDMIPQPISFYGTSKKYAEDAIRKSTLSYLILRPVAVYGPHDTETLKYIQLMNYGVCPIIGFGEKYLNLIYVEDLVYLMDEVLTKKRFDNAVHFANDNHCYSFNEIADAIAHALHRRSFKIRVPQHLAVFYALLNDVFMPQRKRLVWRDKVRELAQQYWLCRTDTLKTTYGFIPRFTLEQGMTKTITWYKNHGYL